MKKDPDTAEEAVVAHQIRNWFIYNYKNRWVSEKELRGLNRKHTQVFNYLVKEGMIERKKTPQGYTYKWKAQF